MNDQSRPVQNAIGLIIPAWNAEHLIHRSLKSIIDQSSSSFTCVHVIVALNDGREKSRRVAELFRTAIEAKGFVYIVTQTRPGRRKAIGEAEALLPDGHRTYLDQDAALSPNALEALGRRLGADTPPIFVALRAHFTKSASPLVRAFLRAWLFSPYTLQSPSTAGLYIVSREGRKRWTSLPEVAADDKIVRMMFEPRERSLLSCATYQVVAPTDLGDLVKARVRYMRSNRELAEKGYRDSDVGRWRGALKALRHPQRWVDVIVALAVLGLSALVALRPDFGSRKQ